MIFSKVKQAIYTFNLATRIAKSIDFKQSINRSVREMVVCGRELFIIIIK